MSKTEELKEFIISNPKLSNRKLEEMFGVGKNKISKIKKELGIKQVKNKVSKANKQIIVKNAGVKTSEELSIELDIPPSTIRRIWQEENIRVRKLFNPDKNEFIDYYNNLKSSRKVAEIYNVDKATILNFAKKIGYKNYINPLVDDQDIEFIKHNYHNFSARELSERFGTSTSRISQIWLQNDLKGKVNRTYYSNFNYFESIDHPNKAYYLGFIAADGCVYDRENGTQQKMLSIGIHSKDEEMLQLFLNDLESNNPITHHENTSENGVITPVSQIQIVSDKICDDLSKYNIKPRKTWTFKPKEIPKEYLWHFIRGYFDGDGSISVQGEIHKPSNYQIAFVGNKHFIDWLSNIFNQTEISHTCRRDNRKYTDEFYYLTLSNMDSKYKFINMIYNDANVYLSRKKRLSESFIDAIKQNKTKRVKVNNL